MKLFVEEDSHPKYTEVHLAVEDIHRTMYKQLETTQQANGFSICDHLSENPLVCTSMYIEKKTKFKNYS